jgi:hypothetical protein
MTPANRVNSTAVYKLSFEVEGGGGLHRFRMRPAHTMSRPRQLHVASDKKPKLLTELLRGLFQICP